MRNSDYISNVDKHVGAVVQKRRIASGLTRQQLASKIGVTHQQLAKYEQGNNRISVGRLLLIAKALGVDFGHFLGGLDSKKSLPPLRLRMSMEVSRNFMKITNDAHQELVHIMVRTLAREAK